MAPSPAMSPCCSVAAIWHMPGVRWRNFPRDWSPDEEELADSEERCDEEPSSKLAEHAWWIVGIVGLSMVSVAYLFTRSISVLGYAVLMLAILGLCLYVLGPGRRR
jgi:hypothetical protein